MFNLIPWKTKSNDVAVSHDGGEQPMARFRNEFDSLLNRFFGDWDRGLSLWDDSRFGMNHWHGGLEDKENEYLFHAELPGFEPEDLDVKVSGNTLTVKAEHKDEQKNDNGTSYRYGSFHRSFTLPHGIEQDKIDAQYRSGVLEIHLPKTEESKGKRIAVNAN